jgi:hypothetical protein
MKDTVANRISAANSLFSAPNMRVSTSLAFAVAAALVAPAIANFHILGRHTIVTFGDIDDIYDLIAVDSNKYNCNTMMNTDSAVEDYDDDTLPGNGFFRVKGGLQGTCGKPPMNFYRRNNGNWEFYTDDGRKVGDCFANSGSKDCSIGLQTSFLKEYMWCTGAC